MNIISLQVDFNEIKLGLNIPKSAMAQEIGIEIDDANRHIVCKKFNQEEFIQVYIGYQCIVYYQFLES